MNITIHIYVHPLKFIKSIANTNKINWSIVFFFWGYHIYIYIHRYRYIFCLIAWISGLIVGSLSQFRVVLFDPPWHRWGPGKPAAGTCHVIPLQCPSFKTKMLHIGMVCMYRFIQTCICDLYLCTPLNTCITSYAPRSWFKLSSRAIKRGLLEHLPFSSSTANLPRISH